ncbi:MAG: chemotaxis protein CheR [Rhodospirillaceae bacterium]|nr:MAG: chemotaxis protein CheR [Rhodospirillaceae bacterium]
MPQTPGYFEYVRKLLLDRSGLVVTPEKVYLLESRLLPLAFQHGFKDIAGLIASLQNQHNESLTVAVVEAMHTHESLFYRDLAPFKLFQDVLLPQLLQRRNANRKIRIWCAACSTGQEPFSLAMLLAEEAARLKGWKVEIVATDVSHSILSRASKGVFTQFEVQRGLPVAKLIKHFTQEDEKWRINADILNMVQFRHANLLDERYNLGKFDVVFCRNVLIYFDLEIKAKVMAKISHSMVEDGVLFLGSSESTIGITQDFWPVKAGRGVYKHTDSKASLAEEIA